MAASDIFMLEHPMAARLVRILYVLALVFIVLGVVLGVARGITAATRMPPPVAAAMTPGAQAQIAQPGLRGGGLRRFAGRPGRFVLGINVRRQPALYGSFLILRSLIGGFIALLVVRILAEMALAILAMPRRGET